MSRSNWKAWREARKREAEYAGFWLGAIGVLAWALKNPEKFRQELTQLSDGFASDIRAATLASTPPTSTDSTTTIGDTPIESFSGVSPTTARPNASADANSRHD